VWFSSAPQGICRDNPLNYATTASFHYLPRSLFINHLIRRCLVRPTESGVFEKTKKKTVVSVIYKKEATEIERVSILCRHPVCSHSSGLVMLLLTTDTLNIRPRPSLFSPHPPLGEWSYSKSMYFHFDCGKATERR
jgi:hypothetical protein